MGWEVRKARKPLGLDTQEEWAEGVLGVHLLDVKQVIQLSWDQGGRCEVAAAGPAVGGDVLFAWDKDQGEAVWEKPDFLVVEAQVRDNPWLCVG